VLALIIKNHAFALSCIGILRIYPKYAVAWNNKGRAPKLLGKTSESDAAFAKAKELGYTG